MNVLVRDNNGRIVSMCQWCRVEYNNSHNRRLAHIRVAGNGATCDTCGIPHTETEFDEHDNPLPKPAVS